ncbi:hypothetical protein NL676_005728 [Syzygium grande]|nr:hypothetical protein NL676_005728 [Syzygium grande]
MSRSTNETGNEPTRMPNLVEAIGPDEDRAIEEPGGGDGGEIEKWEPGPTSMKDLRAIEALSPELQRKKV